MNGVGVIIVKDEEIIVAGDGWADKTASLIRESVSCDFNIADIDVVGAEMNWIRLNFFGIGGRGGIGEWEGASFGALGGLNVGSMGVAMALKCS